MTRWRVAFLICIMTFCASLQAQTIRVSCPLFLADAHQRISCVEALLEQDKYHFTLASLPTSNGFGPGLVLTHTIQGTSNGQQFDMSVTGAATTNSSWFAGGDMTWSLPFRSSDTSTDERNLASASTKNWHTSAIHLSVSHRTVRTLFFYGTGSGSPDTKYVYAEDDTWGQVDGRVPLSRSFVLTGGFQTEATALPPIHDSFAVLGNVPADETSGINHQPSYLNSWLGIESRFYKRLSHPLKPFPVLPPSAQPLLSGGSANAAPPPVPPPHLQAFWKLEFDNNAALRWQHPTDGSPLAFRQFRFEGDERLNLHAWLRNAFVAKKHPFVYHMLCQGQNKKTDECNLLIFDLKSLLTISGTPKNNQIPFYLEPTLGGNDIDGNVTLRGWDDYRFRDRDAALLQFEGNYIVWDPFGVYAFYDAGTVGSNPSDLAVTRFRQDVGVGLSVRVQDSIVAQTYYAWGAGHGARWGYNFAKVF